MVDQLVKKQQYEYKATASLVVRTERGKLRGNEPSGEAASLVGKKLEKFGDLAVREKPPGPLKEKDKEKSQKKKEIFDPTREMAAPGFRASGHVLETNIGDEQLYRPRTRETRALYEELLSIIQRHMGDASQAEIRGAADQALAILKTDPTRDAEKKKELEILFGDKLSEEDFNQLLVMSKKFIDYTIEEEDKENQGNEQDQLMDIAVNIEEEENEEMSDKEVNIEQDEENKEGQTVAVGTKAEEGQKIDTDFDEFSELKKLVSGYWLQEELLKYFPEPEALQIEKKILEILGNSNSRIVENQLLEILDYEKQDLYIKLLEQRYKIYYLTLYGKAQTSEEKNRIISEMRETPEGLNILNKLEQMEERKDKSREKTHMIEREAEKLQKINLKSGEESENMTDLGMEGIQVKDIDNEKTRKILDLESMIFAQGAHFMSATKCTLPKATERKSMKSYEEIKVPPPKQKISEDEKLVSISEIPEWAQQAFPPPIEKLNRIQSKIYKAAFQGSENLLVCAPTGAGKTNIAMLTILQLISMYRRPSGEINTDAFKAVYIAPMKALVAELVGGFSQRLSSYGLKVRELTGDVHLTKAEIDAAQVIVTTPEKWDVITRKSAERSFINKVKLIIIDEIHLLHDMRGPVLESLVARTIRQIESTQELVRIVALSATLPNYKDVAAFLRVKLDSGLFFFDSSYRPVPLEQIYIGITEKKAIKRLMLMNEILYEKVMERAGQHQILVFVHSRKETARTAKVIRDMALAKDQLAKFLKESAKSRDILESEATTVKNVDLKELLVYGIGIHHAGLNRKDRNTVESLFADKHLQVLVSTATLAWGVNLPAHTVIIKGTQIYSPEQGRWVELSPQDILQMMGRAGRPHYDKTGEGIVITTHSELQYYLSLNNMQLPIESQFFTQLPDHLNAEIVLGTVNNTKEAVTWLGYTYLYVRMLRSPELYGISAEDLKKDKFLVQHRADLIHTAATILDKANLIKYDRKTGIFQVTQLGRVASHYYIKHDSMSIYNENLKPNMGMIDLFRVFAMSKEFQYVIIREEEKAELRKFADTVPVPIKASLEEPLAKIIVLLQVYISRFKLEAYALNADMVYVSQSAGRIMRAIFEIALKRGWAQLAETALKSFKMVDRRMWSVASPLRQFKGIPEEVLRKLEKKEQFTWDHYYDMNAQQLGELVKFPKIGKTLYTLIHQVPKLELSAYVQPITRNCLSIELTIIPKFEWDTATHGFAEPFWVIVEDVDEELILHYEQLIIKQKYATEEHVLNFTVMLYEPMPPQYFIKVVSDRWINSEAILPISFRHLMLPEKFPPHVELLDLPPLKPSELNWPKAEKALFNEIVKFNSIQTQTFNSLYNSDENVFIGAPTTSGKTTCAEFAILRMLKQKNTGIFLYVASMAPVCQMVYKKWKKSFNELGVSVNILTGQSMIDLKLMEGSEGRIIIATAEQWDILSRRWKQRKQVQDVSLMIVDEIQLLSESGSVLEVVLSRMRYMSSQLEKNLRIIGLAVSIADSKDIAEWLGVKPQLTYNFQPIVRPIPLELNIQGFEHNERAARLYAMTRPAYNTIKQYATEGKRKCILFTSDRKQTRLTALDFLMHANSDTNPDMFIKGSREKCQGAADKIKEKALAHVLAHGIGYLHDGLNNKDKQIVRELYETDNLQLLVVAYNLCWEISDLYCYLSIVLDPQRYDGHEHRYVEFSIPDMLQMLGRAGQPGLDDNAKFFVFCHTPRKDFFKKFLYESLPIESHLDHFLHDHLNAEVVAQTIESKHDTIDWLTWTFYYRRLTKNPNYYNLQGITGEHINDHLSELVENTVEELEKAGCLQVENDVNLLPANLGKIASYYYIRYLTIQMFTKSLNEGRKLRALLEILSASTEFEEIPIRHGEEGLLNLLNNQIEYHIENAEKLNLPSSKANILLQCHFGRIPISADFATDQKFILEKSIRLIHAMIDVISSNGWLKPALLAMEMSQMVTQAIWATDSPLWQLPHFDRELIGRSKEMGVNDILDLMNMESEDRDKLLSDLSATEKSQIASICNRYPTIDMKVQLANTTPLLANDPIFINISLARDLENEQVPPVYAPYYPLEKEEYWWIVIGDSSKNKLLGIKRMVVSKNVNAKLNFVINEPGKYQIKTYLICDSYVGADQEETLNINVIEGAQKEENKKDEPMAK